MKGLLLTDLLSALTTSAVRPRVLSMGQDSLGRQDARDRWCNAIAVAM